MQGNHYIAKQLFFFVVQYINICCVTQLAADDILERVCVCVHPSLKLARKQNTYFAAEISVGPRVVRTVRWRLL